MIDRELRAPAARGGSLDACPPNTRSSGLGASSRALDSHASPIEGQSRNSASCPLRGALTALSPVDGPMGGGSAFVEVAVKSRPAP